MRPKQGNTEFVKTSELIYENWQVKKGERYYFDYVCKKLSRYHRTLILVIMSAVNGNKHRKITKIYKLKKYLAASCH